MFGTYSGVPYTFSLTPQHATQKQPNFNGGRKPVQRHQGATGWVPAVLHSTELVGLPATLSPEMTLLFTSVHSILGQHCPLIFILLYASTHGSAMSPRTPGEPY